MSRSSEDAQLLIQATWQIYRRCLIAAGRGLAMNWWVALVPLGYFVILLIVAPLAGLLGVAGGFLLGLVLAVILANYFVFLRASANLEKVKFRMVWQDTLGLLGPVITVLFLLFIVSIVADKAFRGPDTLWVKTGLNLVIVVLFNPLPEVTYCSRGNMTSIFGESFAFVKENAVEWFIPLVVLLCPIILHSPEKFLVSFAEVNPMQLPKLLIVGFRGLGIGYSTLGFLFWLLVGLVASFYIMIFRGMLYMKLATSSRRKRIYEQRAEGN